MSLPHLDDDALSATLDGMNTDDEGRHLAGCELCRHRLEDFRAVARAVGSPVVLPPPAAVEASIRTALDAAVAGAPAGAAAGAACRGRDGRSDRGGSTVARSRVVCTR